MGIDAQGDGRVGMPEPGGDDVDGDYGPPASGKDTITAALTRLDARFTLLPKLKVGTGRADGYEFVSAEHLDKLRDAGRLVAETRRYGNVYAIDRQSI